MINCRRLQSKYIFASKYLVLFSFVSFYWINCKGARNPWSKVTLKSKTYFKHVLRISFLNPPSCNKLKINPYLLGKGIKSMEFFVPGLTPDTSVLVYGIVRQGGLKITRIIISRMDIFFIISSKKHLCLVQPNFNMKRLCPRSQSVMRPSVFFKFP